MRYHPHTDDDVARMLGVVGQPSVEGLFAHIPPMLRLREPIPIGALDERALLRHLAELSSQTIPACSTVAADETLSFLGAGVVPHHVPVAVDAQLTRAEWYSCYTAYQAEMSQGTLQATFEFQTIVCELFGPTLRAGEPPPLVANASMYDGATAAVEGVLMAQRLTGKTRVLVCGAVHPQYVETLRCYLAGLSEAGGAPLTIAPFDARGQVDAAALAGLVDEDLACAVVQRPNYLGVMEDLLALRAALRPSTMLVVACTEPLAMSVAEPPAALGADIVCGEGLGLAGPPSFGGPGVGLFAARAEHVRQMPGRIAGETVDAGGKRGYVLTLTTREQHIRRERATSNICSDSTMTALAFTIHLTLRGRTGFVAMGRQNLARAEYARRRLSGLRGFELAATGPTFNEFAVRVRGGDAARVAERLLDQRIFCGTPLDSPGFALPALPGAEATLLLGVSEIHRREDIDRLVTALDGACP
jgi:glycine dehydrogenase subunit 1